MKTSNRIREDERIEGIIRGLLKLPENRRCINCNSLGPQYVCTTFLTFVCTNCSGVHREFTHRVKSISMAKFTAEEVSALQAAGNERARQIYLKEWDPHRNSYPDGSNLHRLRDFIKHVYVDRKYAGEKSDKLPRVRLGETEESYESRKVGGYVGEFRSPRYESRNEQSSSGRSYPGRRSDDRSSIYYHEERNPQYNPENSRFGGHRKSSVRIEIVDNRFRDDTSRSSRRSESRNFTNGEYRSGSKSPDSQANMNISTTLVVRPIREILGENTPPLEIGHRLKAIDGKAADSSANNQNIAPSGDLLCVDGNPVEDAPSGDLLCVDGNPVENAPSGDLLCVDGNPVEHKKNNSESLINFSTDSEPADATVAALRTQQITLSSDGGNQSPNEPSAKETAAVSPMPNTLEFLIFELSAPMVVQSNDDAPSTVSASNTLEGGVSSAVPSVTMSTSPSSIMASATASITDMAAQPSGDFGAPSAGPLGQMSTLPNSFGASTIASSANVLVHPAEGNVVVNGVSPAPPLGQMMTLGRSVGDSPSVSTITLRGGPHAAPDINVESIVKAPDVQQLSSMQPCLPLPSSDTHSISSTVQQTTTPVVAVNNQPWISSLVPNTQGDSGASADQSSETVSKAVLNTSSRVGSEPLPVETKYSGRKELPADLFTASYLPGPSPVPHWQTGPPNAMGFGMQYYPNAMLVPAYSNPAKSTNPFDISTETAPMQVPQFPSMASPQEALPNADLLHTSNSGAHSLGLIVSQSSSYASAMHAQSPSPSFSSHMSPSAFMGQHVHTNMALSRLQGVDGFGSDRAVLGPSNIPQQPTSEYFVPTTANSFPSKGGNPFG